MSTTDNIRWLSNLSKIQLNDEELIEMEQDMSSIMVLMDSLGNVSLPTDEAVGEPLGLCALRDDTICESIDTALLISQCKTKYDNCFSIPKIME